MTKSGRRPLLFLTRGLDPVGTGRQVELAAEACRAAGHDVQIAITAGAGSCAGRLARAGFVVHSLSRRPRPGVTAAVELARLIGAIRPGAIVAWGRRQVAIAAAARRLAAGPVVVAVVGIAPRAGLEAWGLRQADRVVATTAGVAGAIDLVIPGIEPVAGSGLSRGQVAARLGLRPDTVWTLCVAPLEPSTHVDRLLWAIDQLGVVHKGLEHVVVGAGPLLARMRRRARLQHCAERLFVFPWLDCLPDLLPRVRLVWQPGEVADAGCLLAGMAHGVAAVAVESDAAAALVADDQSGRIVAADPMSEFPRRALGIIEDDSLAARYGSAARARAVAEFPVARSTAAVRASIERALTLKPGRG